MDRHSLTDKHGAGFNTDPKAFQLNAADSYLSDFINSLFARKKHNTIIRDPEDVVSENGDDLRLPGKRLSPSSPNIGQYHDVC